MKYKARKSENDYGEVVTWSQNNVSLLYSFGYNTILNDDGRRILVFMKDEYVCEIKRENIVNFLKSKGAKIEAKKTKVKTIKID